MKDAADAIHRNFERIGRDLRERGFEPLADGGRPDIDRIEAVRLEHHAGGLLRSRGAALDEAADGEAVIAPVDQLAGQLGLFRPSISSRQRSSVI